MNGVFDLQSTKQKINDGQRKFSKYKPMYFFKVVNFLYQHSSPKKLCFMYIIPTTLNKQFLSQIRFKIDKYTNTAQNS